MLIMLGRVNTLRLWGSGTRMYASKAFRREPVKIFTRDGQDITPKEKEPLFPPSPRPVLSARESIDVSPKSVINPSTRENNYESHTDIEYDGPRYIKLKDSDKKFMNLFHAVKLKNYRTKRNVTILEGKKLVMDALRAGAVCNGIYFTYTEILKGLPLSELEDRVFKISQRQLSALSNLTDPPGIIAICEIPRVGSGVEIDPEDLLPITLVCDNVRDPGNMGTLLRSATAVGCKQVLVTNGSVDVWDPKVMRAGAGAHFQIKLLHKLPWHSIINYLSPKSVVYLAETQIDSNRHFLSKSEPIAENIGEQDDNLPRPSLPIHNVYDHAFPPDSEVVLVVGNEHNGLSEGAYGLATDKGGSKIFLPMKRNVDSLNAAMAGTALLFEVQRQFYKMRSG